MAPVWLVERFFAKAKCFALTDSPHPDTKRCCVQFDTAPMAYSLSFLWVRRCHGGLIEFFRFYLDCYGYDFC